MLGMTEESVNPLSNDKALSVRLVATAIAVQVGLPCVGVDPSIVQVVVEPPVALEQLTL